MTEKINYIVAGDVDWFDIEYASKHTDLYYNIKDMLQEIELDMDTPLNEGHVFDDTEISQLANDYAERYLPESEYKAVEVYFSDLDFMRAIESEALMKGDFNDDDTIWQRINTIIFTILESNAYRYLRDRSSNHGW